MKKQAKKKGIGRKRSPIHPSTNNSLLEAAQRAQRKAEKEAEAAKEQLASLKAQSKLIGTHTSAVVAQKGIEQSLEESNCLRESNCLLLFSSQMKSKGQEGRELPLCLQIKANSIKERKRRSPSSLSISWIEIHGCHHCENDLQVSSDALYEGLIPSLKKNDSSVLPKRPENGATAFSLNFLGYSNETSVAASEEVVVESNQREGKEEKRKRAQKKLLKSKRLQKAKRAARIANKIAMHLRQAKQAIAQMHKGKRAISHLLRKVSKPAKKGLKANKPSTILKSQREDQKDHSRQTNTSFNKSKEQIRLVHQAENELRRRLEAKTAPISNTQDITPSCCTTDTTKRSSDALFGSVTTAKAYTLIGKRVTPTLFDTGASPSAMRLSVWHELQTQIKGIPWEVSPPNFKLSMPNGTFLQPVGIATVPVTMVGRIFPTKVCVVPVLPIDLILGLPAMRSMGAIVDTFDLWIRFKADPQRSLKN